MTLKSSSVWDSDEFRTLLAEHKVGPAFALVRRSLGLSQSQFGDLLLWDRSHAGRVEREEVSTPYDVRELVRIADTLGIPRRALLPALLGTADRETIECINCEGVDMDMNRRRFGLMFGAGSALLASTAIPGPAAAVPAHAAAGVTVGEPHLAHLTAAAEKLWAEDGLHGSGGLAARAARHFGEAKALLDHGVYDPKTGDALATVTGNLANCTAWLSFDSGDMDNAYEYVCAALEMAGLSGDPALWADVMDNRRHQAWHAGNNRRAMQLSLRIDDAIRHNPSARLHALSGARLAVAHAAMGDARGAEAAAARAQREVERGFDPDDPSWLDFVTPSEIRSVTAAARNRLGDHEAAVEIYRESLAMDNLPRDDASYHAYCSASLAKLGDHHEAVAEGLASLTLLDGPVTSRRLLGELRPVRVSAGKVRGDEAEKFRTDFDRLVAA
jgi:transcriptional regulator with XRE-family HTH domain